MRTSTEFCLEAPSQVSKRGEIWGTRPPPSARRHFFPRTKKPVELRPDAGFVFDFTFPENQNLPALFGEGLEVPTISAAIPL